MICATAVLKPGPARVGHIAGNITLPRTVPVVNLFAAGGGAFLMLGIVLIFTSSLTSLVLAAAAGGSAGWAAVSYSPLRGETLARWFGLQITSRIRRIEVDGRPARAYVGICPLPETARGSVRIIPGAVDVLEGSVDDRGRFLPRTEVFDLPSRPTPTWTPADPRLVAGPVVVPTPVAPPSPHPPVSSSPHPLPPAALRTPLTPPAPLAAADPTPPPPALPAPTPTGGAAGPLVLDGTQRQRRPGSGPKLPPSTTP
jgi:hypothetical protein